MFMRLSYACFQEKEMLEWKRDVQVMLLFCLATAQVKDRMDILSRQVWQFFWQNLCLLLVRKECIHCIHPAICSKYVAINAVRM